MGPGTESHVDASGGVIDEGRVDVAQANFDTFGQTQRGEGVDSFGGVIAFRKLEVDAWSAPLFGVARRTANGEGFEGDAR